MFFKEFVPEIIYNRIEPEFAVWDVCLKMVETL